MSDGLTLDAAQSGLAFAGYAAAALAFTALTLWRTLRGVGEPAQRLLLAGFGLTACWAWLSAIPGGTHLAPLAESFRNLVWLALLERLSGGRDAVERRAGLRLVYGAVGLVLGLQLIAGVLGPLVEAEPALGETLVLLRITAAAGLLVLVHNLYVQADEPPGAATAGASACRATPPSSLCRCSPSAPISRP